MSKDKKIILIPGWMNGEGTYDKNKFRTVLEIWKKRIDEESKVEADWMIGHSLGASWTLLNWKKNRSSAKLILVNPLFPKRNVFVWYRKWRKFLKEEKLLRKKEIVRGIGKWFFGVKKCLEFLTFDFDEILEEIPKENIVIIYGEKDLFYCDQKFRDYILKKNIKSLKVNNVGHNWNLKFDEEIKRIIFS